MASTEQRKTVLEVVNEVRKLIGLNEATSLTSDKQSRTALTLLNRVVSIISNAGDWQEMLGSAKVTASVSTREYSVGVNFPIKNIFEISVSGRPQALHRVSLTDYMRYQRAGGVGTPNFFAIKGIDNQTNPRFAVHPQPSSAQDGNFFGVLYYKKPPVYLTSDADTEIPFAANLVITGLYGAVLIEEAGGTLSQESLMEFRDFASQIQEELNRFDADSGSDETQLVPGGR